MKLKPKIFKTLKNVPRNAIKVNAFLPGIRELFFVDYPRYEKGAAESEKVLKKYLKRSKIKNIWIYYPNENKIVQSLPEEEYFRLRTARNRDIIKTYEQKKYRDTIVGIAGLSVGSSVLSALTLSGGPRVMKIADYDKVEITNLNRIRASVTDIGLNKIEVVARDIYKLDPFARIIQYQQGLNKENLKEFLIGSPRLDIFVDSMDSLHLKIQARYFCRKHNIPVLMVTDNGDNIILDVERFDLEPRRHIFHGFIAELEAREIQNIDYEKWLKLATQIVGPEYLTISMQDSLLKIGKTLSGVPQLGTSATIGGSICAFAIRKIANKQVLKSGRYLFSLEEKLTPGFNNRRNRNFRKKKTKEFIRAFAKK